MNWRAWIPTPWLERAREVGAKIDAMSRRDRGALLLLALALAAALEFLLVLPLAERRATIAAAAQEAELAQAEATASQAAALAEQRSDLQTQLDTLERELAALGSGVTAGEPASTLLQRVLARQPVAIVGMRSLAVEEIDLATGSVGATEPAGGAASAPLTSSALLYRHRFELQLGGDAKALVQAVDALDRAARPLRIERVRLAAIDLPPTAAAEPAPATPSVQATVTLAVVGTERSWLTF